MFILAAEMYENGKNYLKPILHNEGRAKVLRLVKKSLLLQSREYWCLTQDPIKFLEG